MHSINPDTDPADCTDETDLDALINHSFLSRVPSLLAIGMPYAEALVKAKADDDALVWRLEEAPRYGDRLDSAATEARRLMCQRVYQAGQIEAPRQAEGQAA